MFTMADQDEDGRINYEEFLVMITPRKVTSNRHENIFFLETIRFGWVSLFLTVLNKFSKILSLPPGSTDFKTFVLLRYFSD